MKKSAGILVYKVENKVLKVLLCHPGGPYWKNKKIHSWSIPKGEVRLKEKVIDAAIREFKEETNLKIKSNLKYLASKKVNNKKLVIVFCTEFNYNLDNCFSNKFSMEFPKGSGLFEEFFEMDDYQWFEMKEAYKLIFNNQIYFLNKLNESVEINN